MIAPGKPTAAAIKQFEQRRTALRAALAGKASASSESLSRSYGLQIADVQRVLREMGVSDNG